jgi:hypothetical protein
MARCNSCSNGDPEINVPPRQCTYAERLRSRIYRLEVEAGWLNADGSPVQPESLDEPEE